MSSWKEFENSCFEYLRETYGDKYTLEGGSNSSVADIRVDDNGESFYIEVKKCPAQCAQFVLFPDEDTKSFKFSEKNAVECNESANKIISYMNGIFEEYSKPGKKGKEIVFDDEVFFDWVKYVYRNKNVRYFITNNFKIIPLEKISECFDIKAIYRVKRSGSRTVGKKNIPTVESSLRDTSDYELYSEGSKLYVSSCEELNGYRFSVEGVNYMFSKREDKYEVRRLSDTQNSNVIFSLKLKK